MEKNNKNLEQSLTGACVLRSKNIILLKAAKFENRHTKFFLDRTPPLLPSHKYIMELEKEITNRIDEYQRDIVKYLRQILVLNKAYKIELGEKFYFSSRELKDGYVFFYNHPFSNYITGVLILGKFNAKPEDKIKIEPGMIFEFNEIKKYLNQINSVIDNTVALHYATKKIKHNENGKH
jgi:hypothetical protein